MPYRIKRKEKLDESVRRILKEQIDRAMGEAWSSMDSDEAIHQCRKRCKKIRGLLRLVRFSLGDQYPSENATYRDAARELSGIRDAEVVVQTYDALMEHFSAEIDRRTFGVVKKGLVKRLNALKEDKYDPREKLAEFSTEMQKCKGRVSTWDLDELDCAVLLKGLKKTYKRGRKAMDAAYNGGDAAVFHEWRKRTKYHWYHTRLLRSIWKPVMTGRTSSLSALSDILGEEHNLTVLEQTLRSDEGSYGGAAKVDSLVELLDGRRSQFRNDARRLGMRIFAEKPGRLADRYECYWRAWREMSMIGRRSLTK